MSKPYILRRLKQWQAILSDQYASALNQQRFSNKKEKSHGSFQTRRKHLISEAAESKFVETPLSLSNLPFNSGLTARSEFGAGLVLEIS